ncbi:SDR family NAD(P)-dependent oxidoreductase [Lacticaseibacillus baoqingensis]|uniref:SDR family NAD(P)-dependent oxidoreductase n=1 Tax=Lacticaseibacillus baoqingensis TaxID=2486013 RepID=A0ABW4EB80_9LACO|nr:SDR family oxidoreductase [Lacticaseibacillus baoqingensis]
MRELNDKTVVVTGGSAGLGKAIGLEAASRGATVIFLARRKPQLALAQAQASALSGKPAYSYVLDVADPVMIQAVVNQLLAEHTPDVLVNAAGFGYFANALDTPMAVAEKMLRVNVLGVMYLTQLLGRPMVQAGRGQIINIASMAGKMATPKSAIYSASKFAVIGYSNALRLELKPLGVKVMTVNPGPIDTDFFAAAGALDYLKSVEKLVLDPQKLAKRIVNAFGKPVRELNAPKLMALAAAGYTLAPQLGDWLAGGIFNRK